MVTVSLLQLSHLTNGFLQSTNGWRISLTSTTKLLLSSDKNDFEYLRSVEERCCRLSDRESEFLRSFFNLDMNSFQIYPLLNSKRISVTTTCIIVNAILSNPEHWEGCCRWDTNRENDISLKEVSRSLLEANWTYDSFQTPVIVSALCKMKCIDAEHPKYIKAVITLLDQRAKLSNHRKQAVSSYIRYINTKSLLAVVENKIIPSVIVGSNQIGLALERANMVAFDELCRQLAFHHSGDLANFDVIILAYSLLTYYDTSKSIFLTSFARGVVQATNVKIVTSALEVLFHNQALDGTWRKGEPIFTKGDWTAGSGRDIGNSYVFFFDLVGALLGDIADNEPELLAPYLPNLERCRPLISMISSFLKLYQRHFMT